MTHFGLSCSSGLHLVSIGFASFTQFDLVSTDFAWSHLVSRGLTLFRLVSLGFSGTHLFSLGLPWFDLASLGLAHLDSFCDSLWIQMVSLG